VGPYFSLRLSGLFAVTVNIAPGYGSFAAYASGPQQTMFTAQAAAGRHPDRRFTDTAIRPESRNCDQSSPASLPEPVASKSTF
jgi:hypothetical protein